MLNMLRMDLRRIFRSKMFYIAFLCLTLGILLTIVTLRTVTDPKLRQQAIDAGMEITASDESDFNEIRSLTQTQALCSTVYNGGFFFVALYIVAVLLVCSDFHSGFAKNIFSFYGGRWRYFVSKLLCMTAVCAIWIVGTFFVFWLTCFLGNLKFADAGPVNYGMFFGGYLLIGIAFCAQAIFMSVLFRSEGAGIAASLILPGGIAAALFDAILGLFGISFLDKTLYGSVQHMTGYLVMGSPVMKMLIVTAAWFVVWTVLSLWTLHKKDI